MVASGRGRERSWQAASYLPAGEGARRFRCAAWARLVRATPRRR